MNVDVPRLIAALGINAERVRSELWALCPLPGHDDTKPSWSIRDQAGDDKHGQHHCFSCNRGGDVVGLVADVLGLERRDARAWMQASGLTPEGPLAASILIEHRDPLSGSSGKALALPAGVRVKALQEFPGRARSYAYDRGLTPSQVERWGIGYAADGRLGGRIVFPVRNCDGELVSYQARSFDGREPKYLTPNLEVEGGQNWSIFGAEHWPALEERKRSTVVIVEGVLNALACERVAPGLAVAAICGSNVTPDHVLELQSFGQIAIATDPDKAGKSAALAIVGSLARWSKVCRIDLPVGKDANDLPEIELMRLLLATAS